MLGLNQEREEEWKIARYLSWYSIVAQRGNKELPTLQDWIEPHKEEKVIDKKKIGDAFKYLKETWIKPS